MRVRKLRFTSVFRKVPEGYVAYVEELPGANSQGRTLAEARRNLRHAVTHILSINRELAAETDAVGPVIRESLEITAV